MRDKRKGTRRKADRQVYRSTAWAYIILTFGLSAGLFVLEKRDIHRTDKAALAACQRVNTLRRDVNLTALTGFRAFYSGAAREEALIKEDKDPSQAKLHRESAKALFKAAATLRYQAFTDCVEAVKHPTKYRQPAPRAFTRADLR